MGNWSMHIEGAGIHDNGLDGDAEAMLKNFAADLAKHHQVHSVTFTVGSTRELVNVRDDEASLVDVGPHAPLGSEGKHAYRHR